MPTISAKRIVIAAICLLLPLGLLLLPWHPPESAVPTPSTPRTVPTVTSPLAGSRHPWTLAEAREALKRQPDDSYLQFVVMQLARQENRPGEVLKDIPLFAAHAAVRPANTMGLFAPRSR